ncbi:MAG: large extracellular alpha-helical protein, partial [Syntrophobacteraceae bacterium]
MSQREWTRGRFNFAMRVPACMILLGFFAILSFFMTASAPAAEGGPGDALKITRITPSGNDIPPGRQIVLEFNHPVVPLGRMERNASEIPISIEPALSCQWRWLNSSNLACQLDEQHAMVPSTRYTITVRPEFKSEDGAIMAEPVTHSFITQRPKVNFAVFEEWLSPVKPQIKVRFEQAVRQDSIEAHAFFRGAAGLRVGAKVLEDHREDKYEKPGLNWLLSPLGDLPPDKDIQLVVEPGILPRIGTEPGVESRSVFGFRTLGGFRFVGVQCFDLKGVQSIIRPEIRASQNLPQTGCNPQSPVSLLFTSPVAQSELKEKVSVTPSAKGAPAVNPWSEYPGYSRLRELPKKGSYFAYEFENESLKPFSKYRIHAKANSLKDEFGRPIARAIDMRLQTDHLPPELSIYKNMSVLEKGIDTDLPVFASNIDGIDLRYQTFTAAGKSAAKLAALPGPSVRDATTAIPMGVRKLLGAESGVLTGTVSARPPIHLKKQEPEQEQEQEQETNWFFAQVTPFHVHVKMGHFNTLVWITDLQSGEPVPGVSVEIRKDSYKDFETQTEPLSTAVTDSNGIAELAGTSEIDPELKLAEGYTADSAQRFLVLCRKGNDMALVPLMYHFRVDSEGANYQYIPSSMRLLHGHIRAWGATAQGIYKLGDTVQYKIYVRDQANRRFIQPPAA